METLPAPREASAGVGGVPQRRRTRCRRTDPRPGPRARVRRSTGALALEEKGGPHSTRWRRRATDPQWQAERANATECASLCAQRRWHAARGAELQARSSRRAGRLAHTPELALLSSSGARWHLRLTSPRGTLRRIFCVAFSLRELTRRVRGPVRVDCIFANFLWLDYAAQAGLHRPRLRRGGGVWVRAGAARAPARRRNTCRRRRGAPVSPVRFWLCSPFRACLRAWLRLTAGTCPCALSAAGECTLPQGSSACSGLPRCPFSMQFFLVPARLACRGAILVVICSI